MKTVEIALGWLDLVASIVLAGGVMYSSLVAVRAENGQRLLRRAASLLAVVLLLEMLANAYRMHVISGVGGSALAADVLEMRWSHFWLLRAAGLVVLGVGVRWPSRARPALSVVAVGWLLLRSFQGHAGAHGTTAALVDWAHLSLAAAWLGGLTQFLLSPISARRAAAASISRLATVAVAVVVPSGVYAALLHIPDLKALFGSAYGRVLLMKLGMVAILLILGGVNHFVHVPRARRGEPQAEARLSKTVAVELAIGTLILLLTAFLGQLAMPHHVSP